MRRGSGPLPAAVDLCLATLVDKVPTGDRWLHEIKWNGYRLMIRVNEASVSEPKRLLASLLLSCDGQSCVSDSCFLSDPMSFGTRKWY